MHDSQHDTDSAKALAAYYADGHAREEDGPLDDAMPDTGHGYAGLPAAVDTVLTDLERQRDRWQAHAAAWESVARGMRWEDPDLFRALCTTHEVTP